MNILILSHEYPPFGGGGANACQNLAKLLAEYNHNVHLLTIGSSDGQYNKHYDGGSLKLTRLQTKRTSFSQSTASEMLHYLFRAGNAARLVLREEQFDVCLCFFGIPSGLLARRLKKQYGLPYVVRLGGGDVPGFQDRFQLLYKMVSPGLKAVWRDADALIANSSGLRDTALAFCDRYPIDVIWNGVDTDRFAPNTNRPSTVKTDCTMAELLTVCRLLERKGLHEIIPNLKQIEAKSGKDIHWTIVGDGPYRNTLEKLAAEYGVTDKIHFTGHMAQEDIINYYQKADIFVFPSFREGMPNTVLEAMASGLPVLMRKSCQGASELVTRNGLLADDKDFTNTLTEILSFDKKRWIDMGTESRRLIEASFSWEHTARQFDSLLHKIVTKRDIEHEI